MATIEKHTSLWTGFPGAPGYTTWYFASGAGPYSASMRTFWDAIKGLIPSSVTIAVQPTGDALDDSTGTITGSFSETGVAAVVGTAGGAYSAPAGAVAAFGTGAIVGGRRVRGRSFLVPLAGSVYDSDGSIAATPLTTLRTALQALYVAVQPNLVVWHRPVGGSGGSSHPVTANSVPDKSVVLRSRRG